MAVIALSPTTTHMIGLVEASQGVDPTEIPVVLSSEIKGDAPDAIMVLWDRAMKGTADIKDAINVVIDGAAAVHPGSVSFDSAKMTIAMTSNFTAGEVVTWAYDDQHPSAKLESIYNVEADNQTYDVDNQISNPAPPPQMAYWVDENGEFWIDEDNNKWRVE